MAADAVLTAANAILSKKTKKAYALVRPPGHHAHPDKMGGFCFFNNVAITATHLRNQGKRVMIVDWDIHQCNGTQECFYQDDQVLVVSIHRRDKGTFFPYRDDGQPSYVGEGKGKGFHVNVAWETGLVMDEVVRENNTLSGLGVCEYRLAIEKVVLPLLKEFNPDVLLISCGFDAGVGDVLGWANLCPFMYFWMT